MSVQYFITDLLLQIENKMLQETEKETRNIVKVNIHLSF